MNKHPSYSLINQYNKFIINADDFGKDYNLNSAILKSFSLQLITSTSLLANMDGFQDAVDAAHANPYIKKSIGIHINLTEGLPLSEPIKKCNRFCNEQGYFINKRQNPLFFLTKQEQNAIYSEIKVQINKVIQAGILPSHIDSHHHIHTEWGVSKILFNVLKEFGLNKVRCSRNLGADHRNAKKIYKRGFNYYLKNIARLKCTHYFGSIDDLSQSSFSVDSKGRLVEIMVHPMYNADGLLVDDDQQDLNKKLAPILKKAKIISPNEY